MIKHFPKEYKYTLGEKFKHELLELMIAITHANTDQQNRKDTLTQALQHAETIKLLWRIAKDLQLLSVKQYASVSTLMVCVSKQLV
ncbi:MAG: four helix bundle protein [Candidatus Peribacteria bacterium]|nr:MAG: four helix bundle protein [Candidatus Peribacteria bacterium]